MTIDGIAGFEDRVSLGQEIYLYEVPGLIPGAIAWYGVGEPQNGNPQGADFTLVCSEGAVDPNGFSADSLYLGYGTDAPNPEPTCDPFLLDFSDNTDAVDGAISYYVVEAP